MTPGRPSLKIRCSDATLPDRFVLCSILNRFQTSDCKLLIAPACLVVLVGMLSACSVAPPKASLEPWQPPEWTAWRLTGRISVKYLDDGWNAGLVWRHSPEDYDLRLQGPLGQGALQLRGAPGRVELIDAKGGRDTAQNAETLMDRHLGWRLPLSGLRYWIQGRSDPGQPADWQRDRNGRPERLVQAGWQIDYRKFRPGPEGTSLPARIDFERPDLHARLIIDRWEVLQEGESSQHAAGQ